MITSFMLHRFDYEDPISGFGKVYRVGWTMNGGVMQWDERIYSTKRQAKDRAVALWQLYLDIHALLNLSL